MSLLTSDGLLAVHESNSEENMELNDEPSVSDLPDEDPDFAEDFDCETVNEERNNHADAKERNNRAEKTSGSRYGANKRKREQPVPLEQQLERSEQAYQVPYQAYIWIERPARSHFNTEPELVLEQKRL